MYNVKGPQESCRKWDTVWICRKGPCTESDCVEQNEDKESQQSIRYTDFFSLFSFREGAAKENDGNRQHIVQKNLHSAQKEVLRCPEIGNSVLTQQKTFRQYIKAQYCGSEKDQEERNGEPQNPFRQLIRKYSFLNASHHLMIPRFRIPFRHRYSP